MRAWLAGIQKQTSSVKGKRSAGQITLDQEASGSSLCCKLVISAHAQGTAGQLLLGKHVGCLASHFAKF